MKQGALRVFVETGSGKQSLEMEMPLSAATTVMNTSLPDRPYCLRVTARHDSSASLIIEAATAAHQADWFASISKEILAASVHS